MNGIQIFKHAHFGAIRTMMMPDGQIGFVGKDVAEALGYQNGSRDINRHVDTEDRMILKIYDGCQNRDSIFINESGLYSLVLSSKLPQAREFKHWVTSKVLPQIRKTGGYININDDDDENTIAEKAMSLLQNTIRMQRHELAEKDLQIASMKPLADYAEDVLLSPRCYTMTEVAKSLSMTVFELQERLHDMGIIYRSPSGQWMLYARYLKRGYEAYRTRMHESLTGDILWSCCYLVWTEKGKEFVHRSLTHNSLTPNPSLGGGRRVRGALLTNY